MMKSKNLPISEELDFAYLLGLMRPLYDIDEFAWLPELFALIGHESLINLCRYAGGELIRIPTLEELSHSIESLQYFYDVYIVNKSEFLEVPDEYRNSVKLIKEIYDVRDGEAQYS